VERAKTDAELMLALREGDLGSLGEIFQRHHGTVHALCYRLTMQADVADDLAQETFLRLMRYRESFRGDAKLATWLYRVARNVCSDHFQRRARDRAVDAQWSREAAMSRDAGESPGDEILERALAKLAPDRREALVLVRYHGLSYDEVAQVLGCEPGAARVRVHRAMKELRDIYRTLEQSDHGLRTDVRANG
jgi:RNA polymerase sigma factor (sigma-70 family)